MSNRSILTAALGFGLLLGASATAQTPAQAPPAATPPAVTPPAVPPGPNGIAFPENYAKGVLYSTLDRADNKQFRELYVSPPEAIDFAKRGEPLPRGTVLTLLQYRAELDEQGNPKKDAAGRFIKANLLAYAVMEKREGFGKTIPESIRNGEWEYQGFTAARAVNDKANLGACFQCHKPLDKQDFVFSYDKLKTATR